MSESRRLDTYPVHLGRGGSADVLPEFTGSMAWYEAYETSHGSDGADGRLVSVHTFNDSWTSWEVHPQGHEVVFCTAGIILLTQQHPDGKTERVTIGAGEYAINAPGVWHTADILSGPATVVFITAGEGTEHRPR